MLQNNFINVNFKQSNFYFKIQDEKPLSLLYFKFP